MKALSVRQPWAWLIVNGIKDVENRSWKLGLSFKKEGIELPIKLLIHASRTIDMYGGIDWEFISFNLTIPEREQLLSVLDNGIDGFQFGGIVGVVDLVGFSKTHESVWADPHFTHWILENAKPLPFKACKGKLGLFEVEYDL